MGVACIATHDQAELPLPRPGHVLPGHERRQPGFLPGTEKDFYLAGRRRETGAQIDGGICERDGTVPEILHGDTSPFQLEAPDIFQRLAGQILQPQTAGQLSQDPPVRPGIETDIRSRAAHDEGRLAATLDLEQGSPLHKGRHGQHHIAEPGRIRPGKSQRDHQLQTGQLGLLPFRVRHGGQRVVLEGEVGLDGIRISAFHGPESLVQQAGPGSKGRFGPADAVRPLFPGGGIQRGEGAQALAAGILGTRRQQQATFTAESAQQRIDEVGRTANHERLGIASAHPAAMPDDPRRCSGQGTRQLCDDICRDVALAFGPLRRIGAHKVRQGFEILDITLHVRDIVEFFFDQDMQHCQVESQIRAGADAEVLLRLEPRHRGANVHTGQATALVQRVQHLIELPHLAPERLPLPFPGRLHREAMYIPVHGHLLRRGLDLGNGLLRVGAARPHAIPAVLTGISHGDPSCSVVLLPILCRGVDRRPRICYILSVSNKTLLKKGVEPWRRRSPGRSFCF